MKITALTTFNNIRNNIKSNKNTYSNYTNQREYSDEFLNSLYANL